MNALEESKITDAGKKSNKFFIITLLGADEPEQYYIPKNNSAIYTVLENCYTLRSNNTLSFPPAYKDAEMLKQSYQKMHRWKRSYIFSTVLFLVLQYRFTGYGIPVIIGKTILQYV